jgi:hypothetical protein
VRQPSRRTTAMIAAAALACFGPARRAARVPAIEGLKSE